MKRLMIEIMEKGMKGMLTALEGWEEESMRTRKMIERKLEHSKIWCWWGKRRKEWFWRIVIPLIALLLGALAGTDRVYGDEMEVKLPRYFATVLGEVISGGDPYYSFGYNGWPNKKWSVAVNYSYSSWDQEYPQFPAPYDRVDFKDAMWGGRVTRWLGCTRPGTNTNTGTGTNAGTSASVSMNTGTDTVKGTGAILLRPYLALEVNRHGIKSSVPSTEILWQGDVYMGAEFFPSSFFSQHKICVVAEGGLSYLTGDGIWVTYNLGCRYYFDSPKKKRR